MPKISVIVPVYNVEKYLDKCLDSLVNQTLKDIEIIIVNDGSPDHSQDIIDRYANKYSKKVKAFKKENGGLSDARNYGLSRAKGEYVLFVDSDDYIDINTCEKLYNKATSNNYDIVLFKYYIVYPKSKKLMNVLSEYHDKNNISKNEYLLSTPSACNKLFKTKFLIDNKFSFPVGIIYEDYASISTLILYNPKIAFVNKALYYYIQSDVSITRRPVYNKKFEDIFIASDILYDKLKSSDDVYDELEYHFIDYLLYEGSLNFYKYRRIDNIKRISSWISKRYPNWRRNKYYKVKNLKYKILCNLFYLKQIWLIDLIRKFK